MLVSVSVGASFLREKRSRDYRDGQSTLGARGKLAAAIRPESKTPEREEETGLKKKAKRED